MAKYTIDHFNLYDSAIFDAHRLFGQMFITEVITLSADLVQTN